MEWQFCDRSDENGQSARRLAIIPGLGPIVSGLPLKLREDSVARNNVALNRRKMERARRDEAAEVDCASPERPPLPLPITEHN